MSSALDDVTDGNATNTGDAVTLLQSICYPVVQLTDNALAPIITTLRYCLSAISFLSLIILNLLTFNLLIMRDEGLWVTFSAVEGALLAAPV